MRINIYYMRNVFCAIVLSLTSTFFVGAHAQLGLETDATPHKASPELTAGADVDNAGARFGFLNVDSLLQMIGKPRSEESIIELAGKAKEFCEKYGFRITLQAAVYVNPKYDVTGVFANFIQGKKVSNQQIESIPKFEGIKFGFVNVSKFLRNHEPFKESTRLLAEEFRAREEDLKAMTKQGETQELRRLKSKFIQDVNARKKQDLDKILKSATEKTKEIAQRDNIDIVLKNMVYISPEFNITDKLISEMR